MMKMAATKSSTGKRVTTSSVDKSMMGAIIKTPEDEKKEIEQVRGEILSLAQMTDKLKERRDEFAVEAKLNDIGYIEAMDKLIVCVLDGLTEAVKDEKVLSESVKKIISAGKFRELKELMSAFGIIMEKRELLLGFDQTRAVSAADKKRMKLQVVWKGSNGEQSAVQVET
jgi:hypothetical protein